MRNIFWMIWTHLQDSSLSVVECLLIDDGSCIKMIHKCLKFFWFETSGNWLEVILVFFTEKSVANASIFDTCLFLIVEECLESSNVISIQLSELLLVCFPAFVIGHGENDITWLSTSTSWLCPGLELHCFLALGNHFLLVAHLSLILKFLIIN